MTKSVAGIFGVMYFGFTLGLGLVLGVGLVLVFLVHLGLGLGLHRYIFPRYNTYPDTVVMIQYTIRYVT